MTTLSIPEMSCSHCKASVEKAIKSVDPTAVLDFDMVARTVAVQSDAITDAMRAALKTVGYEATAA
ncbi:heavy-metal-associated domain-containing protein [Pseudorhodobacter turbinis]|uniref:Heavy-metal-associated domain-containing protein n=1 Tax=Pseudorhodobacter turbinis TaxID=2500533 RepID=A0A4V1E0R3_9RHOB|nr:heavy-metal-associated domain-containing protein [Pseudorhodobacter turbinis]QCO55534.1 heavy-metal-associated domain-containing protein [Pseudorhodobacter turbinis]